MKMGIVCNDDFQWRLYARDGIDALLKHYMNASINQGRILSIIQVFSLWLSAFPSRVVFCIMKIIVTISNILFYRETFGYLLL